MIVKNARAISEVYKIDNKTIGSGTYGTVHKVVHLTTGHIRACKTIPRSKIKNWDRF